MKTTLKYEFEDNEDGNKNIDDSNKHYKIFNAENMFSVLSDLDQELRDICKEPQKAINMGIEEESADSIRKILREILHDRGVDLDQVE